MTSRATTCHGCGARPATRASATGWRICDRAACELRLVCVECGGGCDGQPTEGGVHCLRCGDRRPPRLKHRATWWRPL